MSTIVINAGGGDNAPRSNIDGAHLSMREHPGRDRLILVGDETELRPLTDLPIIDAPGGVIGMEVGGDDLLPAYRVPGNATRVTAQTVASGRADAMFDAGNSGAIVLAGAATIRPVKGISSPPIPTIIPYLLKDGTVKHRVLLDSGANSEPTEKELVQWAVLGSLCAQIMLKIPNPVVGLLSYGEEDSKGTETIRQANRILHALGRTGIINFIGNVEGTQMFDSTKRSVDVVVTNALTGNALLKSSAEEAKMLMKNGVSAAFHKNLLTILVGKYMRHHFRPMQDAMDKEKVGGSLLLGIEKAVIVGHGDSSPRAVASGIDRASEAVTRRTVASINTDYTRVRADVDQITDETLAAIADEVTAKEIARAARRSGRTTD